MAGFENSVLLAKNMNFDQAAAKPHLGIIDASGKLPIGTGNSYPTPEILAGTITSPDGSLTIGYVSPNITAQVNTSVIQDLHTAKWIVNATPNVGGNQTTIQAAINAAVSGETVFIYPGTYTENLALKSGVNLTAYGSDNTSVIINGKMTYSSAGIVTIYGIELRTNSDYFLEVTGSATSAVILKNCNLNCLNNTGISFTSSNAGAGITIQYCGGNLATSGIKLFDSSSPSAIIINYSDIENTGNSVTASTISAGLISITNSRIVFPITTSGTSDIQAQGCDFLHPTSSFTNLTHGSTGGNSYTFRCHFNSSSSSAVSISAGASLVMGLCTVTSTNVNAITGAGSLYNGGISCPGDISGVSSGINTTTQIERNFDVGGISFDGGTNVLNVYSNGTWTPTIIPTTGAFTSITYGTQSGTWYKIGNMVTVHAYVSVTAITLGGAYSGDLNFPLPFQVSAAESTVVVGNMRLDNQAISGKYVYFAAGATALVGSAQMTSSSAPASNLPASGATADMAFAFSITYRYA